MYLQKILNEVLTNDNSVSDVRKRSSSSQQYKSQTISIFIFFDIYCCLAHTRWSDQSKKTAEIISRSRLLQNKNFVKFFFLVGIIKPERKLMSQMWIFVEFPVTITYIFFISRANTCRGVYFFLYFSAICHTGLEKCVCCSFYCWNNVCW